MLLAAYLRSVETLQGAGVRALKLHKQSLNLNPVAESFVRNITRECPNKMILFGERHVRHVITEHVEHYLTERTHLGLGNVRITVSRKLRPSCR